MDDIVRIIEERKAQAAKKELTKKLLAVCKVLGQPIRSQHGGIGDQGMTFNQPDFPWRDEYWAEDGASHPVFEMFNEKARNADDHDTAATIGYIFDSLNWGKNLEVRYLTDLSELKATFDGRLVYKEDTGNLIAYIPGPDTWEPLLDRLFESAKVRHDGRKAAREAAAEEQAAKRAKGIIQKLREAWGF